MKRVLLSDAALLRIGRGLLALLFLAGAAQKLLNPGAAQSLLADAGVSVALVWPAMVFNAGAGIALIAGWRLYETALALAAYCVITSLFHFQPDDGWQMSIMVKNWSIAGGLLILAATSHEDA